jgi:hypothetical protein
LPRGNIRPLTNGQNWRGNIARRNEETTAEISDETRCDKVKSKSDKQK